jgi:hypothetical protein
VVGVGVVVGVVVGVGVVEAGVGVGMVVVKNKWCCIESKRKRTNRRNRKNAPELKKRKGGWPWRRKEERTVKRVFGWCENTKPETTMGFTTR